MHYYPDAHPDPDLAEINRAVESAFADHGRGLVQMPPKMYVTLPAGDFRTMPAYVPSLGLAGVKIVNVHPDNPSRGLPTVMALTVILDISTGRPVAILNATRLTDLRTGAAGAVAGKYLSPSKEIVLGLAGAGRQAEAQVNAIAQELTISEIRVWSRNPSNAAAFARRTMVAECQSVSLEQVCDCDLLVTSTPARFPIIRDDWIHDGTHINAIGADGPGKEELDPLIIRRASVFVDDRTQALHSGEINVPVTQGLFSPDDIAGTIGEVIIGKTGRRSAGEITVFDSTGLAIQDLAIAKIAMERGTPIDVPFP